MGSPEGNYLAPLRRIWRPNECITPKGSNEDSSASSSSRTNLENGAPLVRSLRGVRHAMRDLRGFTALNWCCLLQNRELERGRRDRTGVGGKGKDFFTPSHRVSPSFPTANCQITSVMFYPSTDKITELRNTTMETKSAIVHCGAMK